MKTSLLWLRDYVDLPWSPAELAERLTMAGLEVEGIETRGEIPPAVVVARILARNPHPNADRLSLCQVDDGSGAPVPVVCGAPNCDAGRLVPMARPGARLGELTIRVAKVRGVESRGMLCSAAELGLASDASGLLELPADSPVGRPLAEVFPPDTVIDWEITSNRPDWLSHLGIAREIAALTGGAWRRPAVAARAGGPAVASLAAVEVQAPDLCPRYTARVIRGVTIAPSPAWLQDRLRALGLRPINNVVDVTNYVMFECGQPLHAFDYDRLAGHRIVVRRAAPGERLTTLDGQTHTLAPDNLVIADGERGVALAGVMGGGNSEITDATVNLLLESAAFHAGNVRRTARDLGLASDASYRFARGVDGEGADWASARACDLILQLAGGELAAGVLDVRAGAWSPPRLRCRFARVDALLGLAIAPDTVVELLARLGLQIVARDDEGCEVLVPSWRPDLEREVDLIEEVARLYGLDRVPDAPVRASMGGVRADDAYYPVQGLREQLVALGLDECISYTLLDAPAALRGSDFAEAELVRLRNPLSADYGTLRPTLVPSLLAAVAHNIARDNHDLRLFELGRCFAARAGQPEERLDLGLALTGRRAPELFDGGRPALADLQDVGGILANLAQMRRLPPPDLRPASHPALAPGRAAEVWFGDVRLGVCGEAHPDLVADIRLKQPLFLAFLSADRLLALAPAPRRFAPLPQFPAVTRDVAFVAPEGVSHAAAVAAIRGAAGPTLTAVELFDIYRHEQQLGPGRRSLAYRLTFRSPERTLTDKEVNAAHDCVRQALATTLGVELR